jgi:hypothetical protein
MKKNMSTDKALFGGNSLLASFSALGLIAFDCSNSEALFCVLPFTSLINDTIILLLLSWQKKNAAKFFLNACAMVITSEQKVSEMSLEISY